MKNRGRVGKVAEACTYLCAFFGGGRIHGYETRHCIAALQYLSPADFPWYNVPILTLFFTHFIVICFISYSPAYPNSCFYHTH